jgi:hypothetical protein
MLNNDLISILPQKPPQCMNVVCDPVTLLTDENAVLLIESVKGVSDGS